MVTVKSKNDKRLFHKKESLRGMGANQSKSPSSSKKNDPSIVTKVSNVVGPIVFLALFGYLIFKLKMMEMNDKINKIRQTEFVTTVHLFD